VSVHRRAVLAQALTNRYALLLRARRLH